MMLLNILLIAYCAGLVSSQDDTYDKEKHTIDVSGPDLVTRLIEDKPPSN